MGNCPNGCKAFIYRYICIKPTWHLFNMYVRSNEPTLFCRMACRKRGKLSLSLCSIVRMQLGSSTGGTYSNAVNSANGLLLLLLLPLPVTFPFESRAKNVSFLDSFFFSYASRAFTMLLRDGCYLKISSCSWLGLRSHLGLPMHA